MTGMDRRRHIFYIGFSFFKKNYFCAVARILAIDYGTRRCGLAVTDPLQLTVNGLETVHADELIDYLQSYLRREAVETIVVGEPLHADGQPAQIHYLVVGLVRKLKKLFPGVEVVMQDERDTSEEAKQVIRQSGIRRKKRRDKALVDQVSATLILKDYLETYRW